MKRLWLKMVWDMIRCSLEFIIGVIFLNNAPSLMNQSSWLLYWAGLVLQIGGFVLLGYSLYDGIKSILKYITEAIK